MRLDGADRAAELEQWRQLLALPDDERAVALALVPTWHGSLAELIAAAEALVA